MQRIAEKIGNDSDSAEGPLAVCGLKYKAKLISRVKCFSLASYDGFGLGAEWARSWV